MREKQILVFVVLLLPLAGWMFGDGTNPPPTEIQLRPAGVHPDALPRLLNRQLGTLPGFAGSRTMAKFFNLSTTNRVDEQFGVKLVSVETNGLVVLQLLKHSETVKVAPSSAVATNRFGSDGLQLLGSSYTNQTAEFLGMWAEIMHEAPIGSP